MNDSILFLSVRRYFLFCNLYKNVKKFPFFKRGSDNPTLGLIIDVGSFSVLRVGAITNYNYMMFPDYSLNIN